MMSLWSQACDVPTCSSIGEMQIFQGTDFPRVVGSHIKKKQKNILSLQILLQFRSAKEDLPATYCDSLIKFNSEKDLPATVIVF